MPQAAFEIVASDAPFDWLPINLEQRSSRSSSVILLLLLVPALAMMLVPLALLAALGVSTLGVAAEQPLAALQVLVGLAIWTVLFVLPAKRILQRFGVTRAVRIDFRSVSVTESGPFRIRDWTTPLSEYSGVAHHVRSTLSGVRHELVLVHAIPERCVLIHADDRVSKATIERVSALLRLPEVPASDLYGLGRSAHRRQLAAIVPRPTTQAA